MLDFKRDYITVHGETEYGHRYVQDGIFYDAAGNPVKKQTEEGKAALAEKAKQAEAMLAEAQAAMQAVSDGQQDDPQADPAQSGGTGKKGGGKGK